MVNAKKRSGILKKNTLLPYQYLIAYHLFQCSYFT